MDNRTLSERLTVRSGGLTTGEVMSAFGTTRAKTWQALRSLELQGVLVGEARDKRGDYVDRKDDGRPATVGGEILWFAPMVGETEGVTQASDTAAAKILELLGVRS